MPPPSPLAIATSSVARLLKEEASYHKELTQQEARIKALEEKIKSGQGNEDGNGEYMLKQERTGVEETKAVFEPLKKRIADAVIKLEDQIAAGEENGAPAEELEKAKSTLAEARKA